MASPNSTLLTVLRLIHKDVLAVQRVANGKDSRWKGLDAETSNKLVKYAKTLSDIINVEDKQLEEAKKIYRKDGTAKLVSELNEITKKEQK